MPDMPLSHPGEVFRLKVLPSLGMSISALARHIGYSRGQLSTVLHGRAAISPDLATRLEAAGLGSAHGFLIAQAAFDLSTINKNELPQIYQLAL